MSESPPDFQDLADRTYRLCVALLRDKAAAEDAAQEALARAWAKRRRKRADAAWWTWCGGFAVRVCREIQRQRRREIQTDADEVDGRLPAPVAAVVLDRELDGLHRAIHALPLRQREVVVLRYLVRLSTAEAAAILGVPAGTIKSNLHKAIASLQVDLGTSETHGPLPITRSAD